MCQLKNNNVPNTAVALGYTFNLFESKTQHLKLMNYKAIPMQAHVLLLSFNILPNVFMY